MCGHNATQSPQLIPRGVKHVRMFFQKSIVFLTLAVVLLLAVVQAIDICDTCKCTREQGEVKSVSCDCNTKDKVLKLSRDKMNSVTHIKSFAVSNCSSVTFEQSSFARSHDLENVSISRVRQVMIQVGVFESLSTLLVEDVSDLQLATMGLLGAGDVHDITIHRTNISVLPTFALFDIKGLKNIELKGVIIGSMKVKAIGLKMADDSRFTIDGCQVDTIERGAVVLETSNLVITNSQFHEITYQAVNVSATKETEISRNIFGAGCSNQGIVVRSDVIEIDRNTFNVLPIGLLKKVEGSTRRITFTNNIVFNFTLTSDGVDLSTMLNLDSFNNNDVVCDCNLAKSVLAYKAFQTASEARLVVQQNYCYTESACKISLQMLAEVQEQVCAEEMDATHIDSICESLPETVPTALLPERGGRADYLPEPSTVAVTTPASTTTTHAHHAHGAEPHHTESAGWRCTTNNMVTSLIMFVSAVKLFGV